MGERLCEVERLRAERRGRTVVESFPLASTTDADERARAAAAASLRLNRRAMAVVSGLLVALLLGLVVFTVWARIEDTRRQLAIEYSARMNAVATVVANARTLAFNVKNNANLFLANRDAGSAPGAERTPAEGFSEVTIRDLGTGLAIGSILSVKQTPAAGASERQRDQEALASFLIKRMHVFRTGAPPFSYGNSYFFAAEGDLFALYPQQSMRLLVEQRADRSPTNLVADTLRPLQAVVPPENEHRGEPAFTEPHVDPTLPASDDGYVLGRHVTSVVYPVYFEHRLIGIVATDILSDAFTVALAPSVPIPGQFLVVSQGGQVVASDQLPTGDGVVGAGSTLPKELAALTERISDQPSLQDGHVVINQPIRGTPWRLVYLAPADSLLEGMTTLLAISALVLLFSASALVFGYCLVNRKLSREIEDRLEAENALRASQAQLTDVADNFPGAIFQTRRERDGKISVPYASKGVAAILGVSAEEIMRAPQERYRNVLEEDRAALYASIERAHGQLSGWNVEFRVRQGDRIHWVQGRAQPHAGNAESLANGFWLDVTVQREQAQALADAVAQLERDKAEQKRLIDKLEEAHHQLLQAEKLAAVGQLAAGVAHEINNPISFVHSNLGALETYFRDLLRLIETCPGRTDTPECLAADQTRHAIEYQFIRDDLPSLIAECRSGLQRVKQIVQDLRDFSRVDSGDWAKVDLRECLESTIRVAASEIDPRADIERDFGETPQVECVPAQINQVWLSLLLNAAQAIPAERRGRIVLRSGGDTDAAWVEIADDGCGMAPELLGRIFEPFFTTKPVGQGKGLGLSAAYSVVKQHGGTIEVESAAGKGTRVRVRLPLKRAADPRRDYSGDEQFSVTARPL